jgi:hypothetical protein
MSTTQQPTPETPQSASVAQPEALQPVFPIGAKVWLRFSPDSDETGEVVGYERGKVRVWWPDWKREGRYHECSLLKVEDRQ